MSEQPEVVRQSHQKPVDSLAGGRPSKNARKGSRLERHEAKYVIEPDRIPAIRGNIEGWR